MITRQQFWQAYSDAYKAAPFEFSADTDLVIGNLVHRLAKNLGLT